jgi:hypothetical protein
MPPAAITIFSITRALATVGALLIAVESNATDDESFPPPQRDYILSCAGCHGINGLSNSPLIPKLKDRIGYFLNFPEGRAYLARLPNVAYSTLSDTQLAAVLNYAVLEIGGDSAPAGVRPFQAVEVGKWRKSPLTENLSAYRQRIVEILVSQYRAPVTLRGYGDDAPATDR